MAWNDDDKSNSDEHELFKHSNSAQAHLQHGYMTSFTRRIDTCPTYRARYLEMQARGGSSDGAHSHTTLLVGVTTQDSRVKLPLGLSFS